MSPEPVDACELFRQALVRARKRANANARLAKQWQAEAAVQTAKALKCEGIKDRYEKAIQECVARRIELNDEVDKLETENADLRGQLARADRAIDDLKAALEGCDATPTTFTIRNTSQRPSTVTWTRDGEVSSTTLATGQSLTLDAAPSSTTIGGPA